MLASMAGDLNSTRVAEAVREVLSEIGSENYTTRIVRKKVAEALEVNVEELETLEMKSLMEDVIQKHIQNISKLTTQNDSKNKDAGSSDNESEQEFEDELDEDGEPLHPTEAKEPAKKLPVKRKPKVTKSDSENPKKQTKKSAELEDQLTRLKSYVFKCGVRKVWKKELDGLSESQAVTRVRAILEELGMDGRPSLEKCKKIKERREFEEEMREINRDKVMDTRLRGQRRSQDSERPVAVQKVAPKLDLSAFGDPDSE